MEQLPSFRQIFDQYKNKVFNTVIGYLQNTEDAEEVTQDVFIEVHHSMSSFEGRSSLSTWVYRIAINKSLDFLKAKNRKKRFAFIRPLFNDAGGLKHDNPDFYHPGVALENKEKSVILFKAVDTLPASQKTAFILAKLEGLSYAEIAEVMDTTVGAVESLLVRAKQNLRKELEGYYRAGR